MDEVRYREAETRVWQSTGKSPREQSLRLERNQVTVRVQEIGEGPAALFVHGGSVGGSSWITLAARIQGFRCILLDRPGCGLSEPIHGLDTDSIPAFAETLLIDVLDALSLESAHLVATSLGGYIAFRAAAAHPARVNRMVQFSYPVGAPISRIPMVMRMSSIPFLSKLMLAVPPNERMARMILRQLGHGESLKAGRITQVDVDGFLALLRHTDTMRNEIAVNRRFSSLRGVVERLALTDDLLAKVTTPTFLMWGENDPFGGPATAREVAGRLPNAELEIMKGAGHAPWLDDLDHAASAAQRFLAS